MAVALRSAGTPTTYASGQTSTVIPAPAGIVNGDLLLFVVFGGGSPAATPTPPAGLTQITGSPTSVFDASSFNGKMWVYYKIASGESGSYTFTHPSQSAQGFCLCYSGVDQITPFDVTPTTSTGTASTLTATGLTTVTNGSMLVFIEHDWGDDNVDYGPPSGMTERVDVRPLVYAADQIQATAGASGNKTHTCNSTVGTNPWAAYLIALRPYVAPTGLPGSGGIIGYDHIQGTATTASSGYSAQAIVHPDLVYTAAAGDVVTDLAVYSTGGNAGDCNMAIYEIVAGVPTTMVGAVVNVPITIDGARWYHASASIPLTAGKTYGVAIDYVGTMSGWFFTYGGTTGMTAGHGQSNYAPNFLPATWSESGTDANVVSYCAKVTGTTPTLLTDRWNAVNGSAWNLERWPVQRDDSGSATGIVTIDSSSGHMFNGARQLAVSNVTGSDFELIVKGSWNTLASKYPEIDYRVSAGLIANSPGTGYIIQISGGSGGKVDLLTAAYSGITTVVDTALNSSTASFWFKVRCVGSNHKIRWWPVSGSEPGTWQIDLTDTQYIGGHFALHNWGDDVYWDDITVTDLSGITTPKAARWNYFGGLARTATGMASSDVTMCAWIKREDNVNQTNWFGVDDTGTNYWALGSNASSTDVFLVRSSGDYYPGFTLTNNVWHHVAITYTTSTGISRLRIMPLGGAATTYTSASGNGPGNWTMQLGGAGGTGTPNCDIANFKVWTAALSDTEIDAEATCYRAARITNLWGEYSFFNGVNTLDVADLSGNARHLTMRYPASGSLPFTGAGPTGITETFTPPTVPSAVMFLAPTRSTVTLA